MATTNYSFHGVVGAWLLCAVPQFYAVTTVNSYGKGAEWLNSSPRAMPEILKTQLDAQTYGRVCRALAAQFNGFENLPLFAIAVLAANVALMPVETINQHIIAYLVSRFVYNIAYIAIGHKWLSFLRSGIFAVGIYYIGSLLYLSFDLLNERR